MALDQDVDAFWSLTLREVGIVQNGTLARLRREHDERAWAVHTLACLQHAKKMPELKSLLSKGGAQRPAKQHWKAQEAIMQAWG